MISSLSVFFRTSLSKGKDEIPLSEEKRHTISYLEIQKSRYRDILEFEIHIPEMCIRDRDGRIVKRCELGTSALCISCIPGHNHCDMPVFKGTGCALSLIHI